MLAEARPTVGRPIGSRDANGFKVSDHQGLGSRSPDANTLMVARRQTGFECAFASREPDDWVYRKYDITLSGPYRFAPTADPIFHPIPIPIPRDVFDTRAMARRRWATQSIIMNSNGSSLVPSRPEVSPGNRADR